METMISVGDLRCRTQGRMASFWGGGGVRLQGLEFGDEGFGA